MTAGQPPSCTAWPVINSPRGWRPLAERLPPAGQAAAAQILPIAAGLQHSAFCSMQHVISIQL